MQVQKSVHAAIPIHCEIMLPPHIRTKYIKYQPILRSYSLVDRSVKTLGPGISSSLIKTGTIYTAHLYLSAVDESNTNIQHGAETRFISPANV